MVLHAALLGSFALVSQVSDAGPRPIEPREETEQVADAGSVVDAGPVEVPDLVLSAAIEPVPVTFGEPFALVITIARDRGVQLEVPGSIPEVEAAPRTGDAVRTVVEDTSVPGPDGGVTSRVKETIRIPFLALDTEDLKTPAFVLTSKDGATVDVPPLTVKVAVPPDDLSLDGGPAPQPGQVVLEGAAPVIAYSVPDNRPWVGLGALAGLGVVAALAAWLRKKLRARKPAAPAVPPPPPRPAHEVALERLEALLAAGLLQKGETAIFVERLMDEVLRDYLAARFTLAAGSRTTRELVRELLGIAVAGLDVSLVEKLLADADLVKFAKASIAVEDAHAMATRVRTLIEQTKEAPGPEVRA